MRQNYFNPKYTYIYIYVLLEVTVELSKRLRCEKETFDWFVVCIPLRLFFVLLSARLLTLVLIPLLLNKVGTRVTTVKASEQYTAHCTRVSTEIFQHSVDKIFLRSQHRLAQSKRSKHCNSFQLGSLLFQLSGLLKPSFTRPWDNMILTGWMAFSPKAPMYKYSETVCIHKVLSLYICF